MNLFLAPFRFDVTPPKGHSLCGGWITPVMEVTDALEAIGFVLLGAGSPIVVCAVDWTGLLNNANRDWRQALADAAHTTPEQVAVQCVHQHNAPFACLESEDLVLAQGDLPHIIEKDFFKQCLDRGREAVARALKQAQPLTHIATGQAQVEKVASNRRFVENGKVVDWRGSATKNPKHHELPEGLIDPWLKTVAFYNGDKKLAACHYYATHPMSFYGDGRVTSDFAGLARKRRQQEEPGATHIYFTGCAGNIAAGKYNDGSPEARVQLTDRLYRGLAVSEEALKPEPIEGVQWRTSPLLPPPRVTLNAEAIEKQIADKQGAVVSRNRPSYMLVWLRRLARQEPVLLSSLSVNQTTLLHLPAECFVEYQLRAQQLEPGRFVATAAYGDGGPWYIPTKEAFPEGGYEVSVALCEPEVDGLLTACMTSLLGKGGA